MMRKWLSPLADPVFKRIFGQEKEILMELINAFIQIDEPVIDIEHVSQELLPDGPSGKNSIVDVRCFDSKQRQFIVEIQIIRHESFLKRVLYYASKIYGRQLPKGRQYKELKPVYVLSILDHSFDLSTNLWLHSYSIINEIDLNKKLGGIHLVFLELEKCKNLGNFTMQRIQDRWIAFLTEPEKFLAMSKHALHEYPNLVKAVELLDESNYTQGQLIAYDKYMDSIITWNSTMIESYDNGFEEGIEKGIEKGRQDGINEGSDISINIIKALKVGGLSTEAIAEQFSVSIKLVQDLKDLI
jgi:predicted transposase/invertase (TIGR01784 family)